MTVQFDVQSPPPAVERLIRAGELEVAAAELQQSGSSQPRADVSRILLRMRQRDFAGSAVTPLTTWPRRVESTLAAEGSIPEITPEQLTSQKLVDGVVGSGSMIVRGLLTSDRAGQLRDQIDRVMAARERVKAGESSPELSAWFERFDPGMSTFAGDSAAYVIDSPIMALEIAELYRDLGITEAVAQYLGERPAVSLRKWVLRRVPATTNTGWHQDGNFLGKHTRNINLWISLSDSGVTSPGLDLVPFRLDDIVESGTGDAAFTWSVGSQVVDSLCGEHPPVSPEFTAGDAVFFDHFCLHRTGVRPGMTETRYAIESWFFAPSHFPADYTGFLL